MSHISMFTMKSLATKDLFFHYVQTIVDTRKACVHLFEAHDLGFQNASFLAMYSNTLLC